MGRRQLSHPHPALRNAGPIPASCLGGSRRSPAYIRDTLQNIYGFRVKAALIGTLFRAGTSARTRRARRHRHAVLLRPTARKNLALPDDGLIAASSLKAIPGPINRIYGKGMERRPAPLKGTTGSSSNAGHEG